MLKNYFRIALRYFRRNKLYTAINVLGLSIGIAACLVIFLIVNFENSFDKFWKDKDRIYRVYSEFSGVFKGINRGVPTAVAPWMADNLTGIEALAPFHTWSAPVTILDNNGEEGTALERQKGIAIVDPAFFKVFANYTWLVGSPEESLSEPLQVVLTPEKARLYFGLETPEKAVGRTLVYKDSLLITVSGIVEKAEPFSDLDFKEFISFSTIEGSKLKFEIWPNNWESTNSSSQLFVKLQDKVKADRIENDLLGAKEAYEAQNKEGGFVASYKLQALGDVHFNGEIGIFDSSRSPADRSTLWLLSLVAILLLLIAAINFINLETAQSLKRSREVGVRKVLGGTRRELIMQFMTSTFMLSLLAVFIAVNLSQWAIYYFDDFIPEGLKFKLLHPGTMGIILMLTLLVTLIAGAYPAFVLSSFLPVKALKDQVFNATSKKNGVNLRRSLVVFQFAIAQILIFGTLTVSHQIKYLLNKDLGFEQNAIVYFFAPRDTTNNKAVLVQELKRMPEIVSLSLSGNTPAAKGYSTSVMTFRNGEEELSHSVHQKNADTAYINLYEMKLLAGRNVHPNDSLRELVINETYARQLGFENLNEAIGQYLGRGEKRQPIVGVVADFHLQSLHEPINPTMIYYRPGNCINLKLQSTSISGRNLSEVIKKVETKWKELYPENDFNYQFIDETIASFYEREKQTAQLVNTATFIAILICCLGLFGLISFTVAQRTKEIGIRKILGASVAHLVSILTRNFLLLVLIALLIASPLAWWLSNKWLSDFAYQIDLKWWQFVLVGGFGLAIALLTVSFHSFRAATANPVESLRHE